MTKVPIGDQPKDIEKQIREIVLDYVKRENCLILAVSPANSDLANSDALKISKEIDPMGMRTIGVITKLDLMDEGTDAREIFENKLLPLRRGYIGVVSRSQKDIDGRKDIYAALESEQNFFLNHPCYRHMANRMGTPYLQQVLNRELIQHIHDVLPTMRERIQKQVTAMEKQMRDYHVYTADDEPAKRTKLMLVLIQQFANDFERVIEGAAAGHYDVNTNELSGGARINRLFHEQFAYEMEKTNFAETELRREIAYAIRNIHGVRIGLFTPDKAFETIVRTQIVKLKEPALRCVDMVVAELAKILHEISEKLVLFPRLRDEVEKLISRQMRIKEKTAKDQIRMMLDIELAYMNTNHEDFIGFQNFGPSNATTETANKSTKPSVENPVIRKGYLTVQRTGNFMRGAKDQWFVLTVEDFTWYNDMSEVERKFIIPVKGLKYLEIDAGFLSRRPVVALYNTDGRCVYKNQKQLELTCTNADEMDRWRNAFAKAGIEVTRVEEKIKNIFQHSINGGTDTMDPQLERQVDIIRNLVESYMKIVCKNVRDTVPKTIVHLLISEMKQYIHCELLPDLYALGNQQVLMEESVSAVARRRAALATYETCRKALRIIDEVVVETLTPERNDLPQPLPMIDNEKRQLSQIAVNALPTLDGSSMKDLLNAIPTIKPPPGPMKSSSSTSLKAAPPVPTRPGMQLQQAQMAAQVISQNRTMVKETMSVFSVHETGTLSMAFGDKDGAEIRLPLPLAPRPLPLQ
ncbi:hypothetical protein RvY_14783 [Ramazzottius varieornatus]|uniref:dynamin GTPase n=1 Tax=Ramazzottius varieornatus TaxID=947166 RepID=A0A1D1VZP9_RAMVA|nr:hypothetical protein RvY_14783 [Ramazzottius varieornatus]